MGQQFGAVGVGRFTLIIQCFPVSEAVCVCTDSNHCLEFHQCLILRQIQSLPSLLVSQFSSKVESFS